MRRWRGTPGKCSSLSRVHLKPRMGGTTLREGCGVAMTFDQATELVRHTLLLTLLIAAPLLIVSLIVGLVSSVLQAATQVQEQTLTFIPKIVATVACLVLL